MKNVHEVFSPRGAFALNFTFEYDGYHHGDHEKMPRNLADMLARLWPLCRRYLLALYLSASTDDDDVRRVVQKSAMVFQARQAVWARRLHGRVFRDVDGVKVLVVEGDCAAMSKRDVTFLCGRQSGSGGELTLIDSSGDVVYAETRSSSVADARGTFYGDPETLRLLGLRPEGLGRLWTAELGLEGRLVEPATLDSWRTIG